MTCALDVALFIYQDTQLSVSYKLHFMHKNIINRPHHPLKEKLKISHIPYPDFFLNYNYVSTNYSNAGSASD